MKNVSLISARHLQAQDFGERHLGFRLACSEK